MFRYVFLIRIRIRIAVVISNHIELNLMLIDLLKPVTVLLGSLFIGSHSTIMIDVAHIWTVFYFFSFTVSKLGILLYDFQFVNCLIFIYKRIGILSDCVR